tara:strand:- start:1151 stop:1354 length:204 start_codon:yes stop_codon:yes gene_type:complete
MAEEMTELEPGVALIEIKMLVALQTYGSKHQPCARDYFPEPADSDLQIISWQEQDMQVVERQTEVEK